MSKLLFFLIFFSTLFSGELRRYDPRWDIDDHSSFDCPYQVVPEPSTYIQAGVFAGMGTVIWLLKKNKKKS